MKTTIACPIFRQQEKTIDRLTRQINQSKDIQEKANAAHELLEETSILLNCEKYDEQSGDCMHCVMISKMRTETAQILLKASQLGGAREG
ncbi:hypothetical protein JXJ21_03050 [candidate division KSB1 bacterium]|nr:hypothetical protein [candidate division KSB1 bacterium]